MLDGSKSRKLKFWSGAVSTNLSTKTPIYLGQRCKKSLPPSTLGPRRGEKSNLCIFCGTAMPQRISFPTVHLSLFHWRLLFLAPPPPHSSPERLSRFLRLPRSEIRLSDLFLLVVCTRHLQPHFNLLWPYRLFFSALALILFKLRIECEYHINIFPRKFASSVILNLKYR